MPVDIPGFYYDFEKKKYFKIVSNSINSDNKYSTTSLKHKRDEVEIKQKISKLKIEQTGKAQLPFVLSDNVLGIGKKIHFNTLDSEISSYYSYRLQSLKFDGGYVRLGTNVYQSRDTKIAIKKILRNNDDLIVCRDSYIHIYKINEFRNHSKDFKRIDPHIDHYEHYFDHSILRNAEVLKNDMVVRTWCGTMNKPSVVQVLQGFDIKFSSDFNNEVINNSKSIGFRIFTCGDKHLNVIDLNRYDVMDSIKSEGDCLSFDFKSVFDGYPNEVYLGYRNSTVKIWDMRSRKFEKASKLKSFNSIINIKKINEFDIICSSIGALNSNNLNLYDIRMGFKIPKLKYESNKVISNVFDEEFQSINSSLNGFNEFFVLQNSNLIEIFKVSDTLPIKTISKFNLFSNRDLRFGGSYFDSDVMELYTTFDDNLMIYK